MFKLCYSKFAFQNQYIAELTIYFKVFLNDYVVLDYFSQES